MLTFNMAVGATAFLALATTLPVLATRTLVGQHLNARDPVISYDPVSPSAVEGFEVRGGGSQRRWPNGWNNTSTTGVPFGLRDSESFYWGTNGNPLANLTTYASGSGTKILSLERFTSVLNTAKCNANNIVLTFTEEVQFDEIAHAWLWVNDASNNSIVFVTEPAECNVADGDEGIRQPWLVTSATFDNTVNIVTLQAEPRTWQQAFSNWHLRVSNTGILPPEHQRRLLARNNNLDKRLSLDFTKSIPIGHSFTGTSLSYGDLSLTCSDCKIEGSLDFDIDISPKVLTINPGLDGYVQFGTTGVGATVELTAELAASDDPYSFEKNLFDIPLPYSIKIPHVMTLGPQLKYEMTGSIGETSSAASLTTGVKLSIPNNALYRKSFDDSSQNRIVSWTPKLTPIKPKLDIASSVSASFAGELRLVFEGSALGLDAEIGFSLAAPSFDIQAVTSKECGKKKNKKGVQVDVGVGVKIEAYEVASAEFLGKEREVEAKQPIFETSTPVFESCVAKATG